MAGPGVRAWSWWWLASGLAFAAAAAAVLVFVASGPPQRLAAGDQLASVAGLLVATAALLVGVLAWRAAVRPAPADPAVQLERAHEELARQVGLQWELEAAARGLNRPEPLRVRWSATSRAVAAAAAEVLGPLVGARATRLRLCGDVTEVAQAWRQLPARQLVVIGAAGAGKSSLAVLLVCQLLADREPGGPVPVLLGLSGWNPRRQHLDAWLAGRLRELYPWVADRGRFGADVPVRLIDRAQVVPVLDGLDEMPAVLRRDAVAALTDAVGSGRPLVLTCRAAEYQDIIAATGTPLARAAVVEIEPVTGAQAAGYLPAGQVDGQRRWAVVASVLKTCPDGPLARALSTPLMVYLARIAYTPPDTDPGELSRFADADAVEKHLLDVYLPGVYAPRTPTRDGDRPPLVGDYPADKAQLWLGFLARHLNRHNTRDLAWWRLINAVPRQNLASALAVGLMAGLLSGIEVPMGLGLVFGVVLGLVFGLGLAVVFRLASRLLQPRPRRMRIQLKQLLPGLAFGLLLGYVSAVEIGPIFGLFALTVGIASGLIAPTKEDDLVGPRLALGNDRTALLLAGLAVGPVNLLLATVAVASPKNLLLVAPITVLTLWLGFAWPRFAMARFWLAARGRLPWRLMRFLDDAHRRGVLRQVGAEYQFRHARLQDHLAA